MCKRDAGVEAEELAYEHSFFPPSREKARLKEARSVAHRTAAQPGTGKRKGEPRKN